MSQPYNWELAKEINLPRITAQKMSSSIWPNEIDLFLVNNACPKINIVRFGLIFWKRYRENISLHNLILGE